MVHQERTSAWVGVLPTGPGAATVDWVKTQMCEALRSRTETLPKTDDRLDAQVGFFVFESGCVAANSNHTRIMTTIARLPAIRIRPDNPNHHLWNNHGTWFLHYTVHPTPLTKERIRRSLGTKDVLSARHRRDAVFAALASGAGKFDESAGKAVAA